MKELKCKSRNGVVLNKDGETKVIKYGESISVSDKTASRLLPGGDWEKVEKATPKKPTYKKKESKSKSKTDGEK